jgi:hypothetical protein
MEVVPKEFKLDIEKYDSTEETLKHIEQVRDNINVIIEQLRTC